LAAAGGAAPRGGVAAAAAAAGGVVAAEGELADELEEELEEASSARSDLCSERAHARQQECLCASDAGRALYRAHDVRCLLCGVALRDAL